MKNRLLILIILVIFSFPNFGTAAKDAVDFHSLVIKDYSFSFSKLSKEEKAEKIKLMDSFWNTVSSDHVTYLPKLREELERADNPSFFYYDGAKLLLSLSKETKDKQLVVASITHSDLSEVRSDDYVRTIMKLGEEGIDTSSAAFRILDYPDFTLFIPTHALKLAQNYSLIFMLYKLPEQLFLVKTINRLNSEKDIIAQKSLLETLWCSVTVLGDKTIGKMAKDEKVVSEVREFAEKLLQDTMRIKEMQLSEIEKIRKQVELDKAFIENMHIMTMKNKDQQLSKEQIEAFKLFLYALKDSDEESAGKMLEIFAKNSDGSVPKEISNYADSLIKGNELQPPKHYRHLTQYDVAELKNLRRSMLLNISDEALDDFNAITLLIRWTQSNINDKEKGK